MKTNLEAILKAVQRIKDEATEANAHDLLIAKEDWKTLVEKVEGFEKELREMTITPNLGEWIIQHASSKSLGEFLTRFIEEVLG